MSCTPGVCFLLCHQPQNRHTFLPLLWARGQQFSRLLFPTHSLGTSSSVLRLSKGFTVSCSRFMGLWPVFQSLGRQRSSGSIHECWHLVHLPPTPGSCTVFSAYGFPLNLRHQEIPLYYNTSLCLVILWYFEDIHTFIYIFIVRK